MPVLSVILPTFNRAHKIAASIQSVLAQTFKDWELVIVDDGSQDHTADIVQKICEQNPQHKIIYVRQENQGPAVARNYGVDNAKGNIITYLDSDDYLYPSALEDIFEVCQDKGALYGISNHNRTLCLVDRGGKVLAKKADNSGLSESVTLQEIYNWQIKTTSSGLFHRKYLFDEGVRWRKGFWIEDLELIMQLACKEPAGFRHIAKVLVDYVQVYGADGLCSNASYADWAKAFSSIYELHKNDKLMKTPEVYLDRIVRYEKLHQDYLAGRVLPPQYKYFPDYFNETRKTVC